MKSTVLTCLGGLLLYSMPLFAQDATNDLTLDGITYSVDETTQTAKVVKFDTEVLDIIIRSSVTTGGFTYSVTTIADNVATADAYKATSLTIPKTVTTIDGHQTFYNMKNIVNIYVYCQEPPQFTASNIKNAMFGCPKDGNALLHIPVGTNEAYKATIWGDYAPGGSRTTRYTIVDDLTTDAPVVETTFNVVIEGHGRVNFLEADGQPLENLQVASSNGDGITEQITLNSEPKTLKFTVIPGDDGSFKGVKVVSAEEAILACESEKIGVMTVTAECQPGMTVTATFGQAENATLHLRIPNPQNVQMAAEKVIMLAEAEGEAGNSFGLPLPEDKDNSFTYIPTPGFDLSDALSEDGSLEFEKVNENIYKVTVPAFSGEKQLNIIEKEQDIQTGVRNINRSEPRFKLQNGVLSIEGLNLDEGVSVYSLSGVLLWEGKANAGTITLPAGYGTCVVRIGHEAFKLTL